MNRVEKQRLIVGAVLSVALAGFAFMIVKSKSSREDRSEYVVITELPAAGIERGAGVYWRDEKVGRVDKISPIPGTDRLAVRLWVRGNVYSEIGEDAVIWEETGDDGAVFLRLDPGVRRYDRRFIKIKAVKGLENPSENRLLNNTDK